MATYVEKFALGSAQTVIDTNTDIAAGNFSGTTTTFDNTSDSTYPRAAQALAMGEFPDWGAAPVANTAVELWGVPKDIDSTDDVTQPPSGTASGGAIYFGKFTISADDALQRRTCIIDILGYEKIDFYIRNGTAQNMNNDGGTNAVVKITPIGRYLEG